MHDSDQDQWPSRPGGETGSQQNGSLPGRTLDFPSSAMLIAGDDAYRAAAGNEYSDPSGITGPLRTAVEDATDALYSRAELDHPESGRVHDYLLQQWGALMAKPDGESSALLSAAAARDVLTARPYMGVTYAALTPYDRVVFRYFASTEGAPAQQSVFSAVNNVFAEAKARAIASAGLGTGRVRHRPRPINDAAPPGGPTPNHTPGENPQGEHITPLVVGLLGIVGLGVAVVVSRGKRRGKK